VDEVRQHFREAINEDIMSRMSGGNFHMNRTDVEQIGERVGMSQTGSLQEFDRLRGTDWEGDYSGADEIDEWLAVHFDPPWFQRNKGLQIDR
jgi:hypothetical protein